MVGRWKVRRNQIVERGIASTHHFFVLAVLIDIGSPPKVANSTDHPCSNDGSDTEAQVVSVTPSENQPAQQSAYKQILSLKAVHLMAFYILVYVGVEVTIGGEPTYKYKVQCLVLKGVIGWIVTYLIHERGGGSSSGYVSSGFFGGWSHRKHNRVTSTQYRI